MIHAAHWLEVAAAGFVIGLLMGSFGVGGSSMATPVLSLIGVPPLAAVASPLPATIPAAVLAGIPYLRAGESRPRAAAWSLAGALPATVAGAYLSKWVGGPALLVASGAVLVVAGMRVMRPMDPNLREAGAERRRKRPILVAACALVGLFTGLLANGGGFLLVPLYLLVFGLSMRQAVGTSLVVISVLAIPTLATHWALGHIDWVVAGSFSAGLLPGSLAGGRFAHRIEGPRMRVVFGYFLVVFGGLFVSYRMMRIFVRDMPLHGTVNHRGHLGTHLHPSSGHSPSWGRNQPTMRAATARTSTVRGTKSAE